MAEYPSFGIIGLQVPSPPRRNLLEAKHVANGRRQIYSVDRVIEAVSWVCQAGAAPACWHRSAIDSGEAEL